MKKNGFTLAEVLITLGIVGLAAALLTPVIGNAIPDKNKTQILKIYGSIANATEGMLDNKALYYGDQAKYDATKGTVVADCSGFACQQQPLQEPYNKSDYTGTKKYGMLLADSLGGTKVKSSGTEESAVTNFETKGGVVWQVETSEQGYSKILVDLNGEKGKNCVYDKSSCPKPDQFRFYVHKNGATYPGDALMVAYLSNPLKLNDKKKDLLVASGLTYDYANVSLTPEKVQTQETPETPETENPSSGVGPNDSGAGLSPGFSIGGNLSDYFTPGWEFVGVGAGDKELVSGNGGNASTGGGAAGGNYLKVDDGGSFSNNGLIDESNKGPLHWQINGR